MTHTFEVKSYDKRGECVSVVRHHCQTLNAHNGHWLIVQRIANKLKEHKKVIEVKVFLDDIEYIYDSFEFEYVPK